MNDFYKNTEVTTDVWLTPSYIISELGHFDLDPASTPSLRPQYAERFYSLENGQDGLVLPWEGRVWLNPPYSGWGKFIAKLKAHGNGIALIFTRTETKAFFDHVWNGAAALFFIKGRIQFQRADGGAAASATAPSVLIAYGENNVESFRRIDQSILPGHLVIL